MIPDSADATPKPEEVPAVRATGSESFAVGKVRCSAVARVDGPRGTTVRVPLRGRGDIYPKPGTTR
jgi:hypothetical protein